MGGSKQNHAIRSCLFLSFLLSTSLDLRICKKKGCDVFPPQFCFFCFLGARQIVKPGFRPEWGVMIL